MIFVSGGAYNGKYDFVKEKYHLNDNDIFDFMDFHISDIIVKDKVNINNLSYIISHHKCIYNIQNLIKIMSDVCMDREVFLDMLDNIKDKDIIIVSDDISCGIVPLDKKDRLYREDVSRTNTYIAKISKEVYRIFAGIPTKIK